MYPQQGTYYGGVPGGGAWNAYGQQNLQNMTPQQRQQYQQMLFQQQQQQQQLMRMTPQQRAAYMQAQQQKQQQQMMMYQQQMLMRQKALMQAQQQQQQQQMQMQMQQQQQQQMRQSQMQQPSSSFAAFGNFQAAPTQPQTTSSSMPVSNTDLFGSFTAATPASSSSMQPLQINTSSTSSSSGGGGGGNDRYSMMREALMESAKSPRDSATLTAESITKTSAKTAAPKKPEKIEMPEMIPGMSDQSDASFVASPRLKDYTTAKTSTVAPTSVPAQRAKSPLAASFVFNEPLSSTQPVNNNSASNDVWSAFESVPVTNTTSNASSNASSVEWSAFTEPSKPEPEIAKPTATKTDDWGDFTSATTTETTTTASTASEPVTAPVSVPAVSEKPVEIPPVVAPVAAPVVDEEKPKIEEQKKPEEPKQNKPAVPPPGSSARYDFLKSVFEAAEENPIPLRPAGPAEPLPPAPAPAKAQPEVTKKDDTWSAFSGSDQPAAQPAAKNDDVWSAFSSSDSSSQPAQQTAKSDDVWSAFSSSSDQTSTKPASEKKVEATPDEEWGAFSGPPVVTSASEAASEEWGAFSGPTTSNDDNWNAFTESAPESKKEEAKEKEEEKEKEKEKEESKQDNSWNAFAEAAPALPAMKPVESKETVEPILRAQPLVPTTTLEEPKKEETKKEKEETKKEEEVVAEKKEEPKEQQEQMFFDDAGGASGDSAFGGFFSSSNSETKMPSDGSFVSLFPPQTAESTKTIPKKDEQPAPSFGDFATAFPEMKPTESESKSESKPEPEPAEEKKVNDAAFGDFEAAFPQNESEDKKKEEEKAASSSADSAFGAFESVPSSSESEKKDDASNNAFGNFEAAFPEMKPAEPEPEKKNDDASNNAFGDFEAAFPESTSDSSKKDDGAFGAFETAFPQNETKTEEKKKEETIPSVDSKKDDKQSMFGDFETAFSDSGKVNEGDGAFGAFEAASSETSTVEEKKKDEKEPSSVEEKKSDNAFGDFEAAFPAPQAAPVVEELPEASSTPKPDDPMETLVNNGLFDEAAKYYNHKEAEKSLPQKHKDYDHFKEEDMLEEAISVRKEIKALEAQILSAEAIESMKTQPSKKDAVVKEIEDEITKNFTSVSSEDAHEKALNCFTEIVSVSRGNAVNGAELYHKCLSYLNGTEYTKPLACLPDREAAPKTTTTNESSTVIPTLDFLNFGTTTSNVTSAFSSIRSSAPAGSLVDLLFDTPVPTPTSTPAATPRANPISQSEPEKPSSSPEPNPQIPVAVVPSKKATEQTKQQLQPQSSPSPSAAVKSAHASSSSSSSSKSVSVFPVTWKHVMTQAIREYTTATRVFTRIALAPTHVKRAALSADKMKTYIKALIEMNKCVVRVGMRIDAVRTSNPAAEHDPLVATLERNRETWTLLCNAAQLAGVKDEPLFVPIAEFPTPKTIPSDDEQQDQDKSKLCCSVCGFPLYNDDNKDDVSEPGVHSCGHAHSPCFILSQMKS